MTLVPGVPNIRVIIREASDENLTVDVPNISVKILDSDQYNVNITPNSVTTLRTGSFSTYADQAGSAYTASYALVAQTLIGSIESASFASTASYVEYDNVVNKPALISSSTQIDYTQIQNQPTTIPTASYVQNAVSSSFALTASYVSGSTSDWNTLVNKPDGIVSSSLQVLNYNIFTTTASNTFIGNQSVTGTISVTGGVTASLLGTASWALNAVTASYVSGAASTWDDVLNKPNGLVSSSIQINTGSFSGSFTGNLIGTSSFSTLALTSSYTNYAITASYISGGIFIPNGLDMTGSIVITGSLIITGSETVLGSISVTNGITASLFGTSSWATNAISSSFSITSSFSVSSSRAVTSSFAVNADLLDGLNSTVFATTGSNTFNGNQTITGSLLTNADTIIFTGSIFTSGSLSVTGGTITGSVFGTSSYAATASYIDGGFY